MDPRSSRDTLLDESEMSDRTALIDRFGRPFSSGEILFREGEPSREAFILHEGRVRLLKRVRLADRSLTVLRPGDLFGESALLDSAPRGSTAVALTDGIALSFDRPQFMALVQRDTVIGTRVVEQLVRRVREAEDQIEVMMLKDTQSKIVAALLKLCGAKTGPVELSISPVDLATRVGLDVDSVKRAVTRLREQQYVRIVGERVEIPDLDALRRLYSLLGSKEELAR
jgi:CRP/FNR family cyclic AMP-dependent transcriptional regulator